MQLGLQRGGKWLLDYPLAGHWRLGSARRQAAPHRYQHIIAGLVQPLNHTRRRNPLFSVSPPPPQLRKPDPYLPFECYALCISLSPSLLLLLCLIYWFFSFKTFPNAAIPLTFVSLLCSAYFILCRHMHVWTLNLPHIISTFYLLHPSRKHVVNKNLKYCRLSSLRADIFWNTLSWACAVIWFCGVIHFSWSKKTGNALY